MDYEGLEQVLKRYIIGANMATALDGAQAAMNCSALFARNPAQWLVECCESAAVEHPNDIVSAAANNMIKDYELSLSGANPTSSAGAIEASRAVV